MSWGQKNTGYLQVCLIVRSSNQAYMRDLLFWIAATTISGLHINLHYIKYADKIKLLLVFIL